MIFLYIFCALVINNSLVSDAQEFRSDYNYFDQVQGWLKFHSIPANWNDARLRCHLEGAVLASPTTNDLSSTMMTMIKGIAGNIFTGIHAFFSKGDYNSIEGVPLSAIPKRGIPEIDNLNDEESCIAMHDYGTLFDVKCQNVFPYICYKKLDKSKAITQNECGTTDNGYQYAPETRSCYKFHQLARTWSRAYMNCMAEGGYLAIINSEAEARSLVAIISKIIPHHYHAYLGFHDWGEHGMWLTINGQTVEETGYSKWDPNEPSNSTNAAGIGEYCGSMQVDSGGLNDINCNGVVMFICEKDLTSLAVANN